MAPKRFPDPLELSPVVRYYRTRRHCGLVLENGLGIRLKALRSERGEPPIRSDNRRAGVVRNLLQIGGFPMFVHRASARNSAGRLFRMILVGGKRFRREPPIKRIL